MASVVTASLLVHTSHLSSFARHAHATRGARRGGARQAARFAAGPLQPAFASAGEALVGLALLYRLGRDAERRRGTDRYVAFVVFVAAFATAAQTWLVMTTSWFAERSGKTTTFHPFTPGPHVRCGCGRICSVSSGTSPRPETPFSSCSEGEARASSKAPDVRALRAVFFLRALLESRRSRLAVHRRDRRAVGSVVALRPRDARGVRFDPPARAVVPTEHRGASRFGRRETFETFVATSPGETDENSTTDESCVFAGRWWPSLVRAFFAATFGWLDPGRDRTGAPRVFVAGSSVGPRARQGGVGVRGAPGGAPARVRSRRGILRAAAQPTPAAVDALTAMGFDEGDRAPGVGGRQERPRGRDGEPAGRRGEVDMTRSAKPINEKTKKDSHHSSSWVVHGYGNLHRSIAGSRPSLPRDAGQKVRGCAPRPSPQQTQVFHALQRRRVKRAGAGGVAFFLVSLKKNPVSPPACVDKPCLCLCFGTLSHTTYSRPLRFTILHASHRRLIAERTCGGGDAERVRGGGSGARSRRRDGDATAGVTPRARGSRDGRNGGARRDARLGRRPSSGARRERTFIATLAVARGPRARASTPAARLSD